MAADTLDVRMARLEEAYNQNSKRLNDVYGDVQQLRGENCGWLPRPCSSGHNGEAGRER
jgi:hypothetical protein